MSDMPTGQGWNGQAGAFQQQQHVGPVYSNGAMNLQGDPVRVHVIAPLHPIFASNFASGQQPASTDYASQLVRMCASFVYASC